MPEAEATKPVGRRKVRGPAAQWREAELDLTRLFEAQAARTPSAPAVTFLGRSLTYGELDAAANRLAHHLIGLGVGPEDFVALLLNRSTDMIVAILAVLKAGAAYLPLDPAYPADRLAFTLQDSRARVLLTQTGVAAPQEPGVTVLALDEPALAVEIAGRPASAPTDADRRAPLRPANLAYVIYTSGSTGRPKGVQITHQNAVRLFSETWDWFGFDATDVWTLFHSYAFDFSVWEIWGALLYGGRLIVVDDATRRSAPEFLDLLSREGVTVLNQTPSAFYQLSEAARLRTDLKLALRYVVFGGEALELSRLLSWYRTRPGEGTVFVNMYGITETTVHVTYIPLDEELAANANSSLIGQAIPDLGLYVLDESMQPAAVGVTGELYVTGEGLARGYMNRPALTAERFMASPFGPPGSRMYRTGDLACWREDGGLDYLGRADQQVKIRGFRIELGEIEAALIAADGVGQAAVIPREIAGDTRLVAYLVPSEHQTVPDAAALRAVLGASLPEHMIPSAFVRMEALPLNNNGKLDRAALPSPEIVSAAPYSPPRNPAEEAICNLFAELTGASRVGVDDNFFDLGGHSLLGVRLIAEVEQTFGVTAPLGLLFAAPTPAKFAERLQRRDFDLPWTSLVPIQTAGAAAPIFMVHWIERDLARQLGMERPVYGLSYGLASENAQSAPVMPGTIEDLAAHYVDELRLLQPHGPYHLVGHSAGGVVAFEMAQQLRAAGQVVAFLGLLDTCAPKAPSKGARLTTPTVIRNIAKTPPKVLAGYAASAFRERITRFPIVRRLLMRGQALPTVFRLRLINKFINDYDPQPYGGPIDFFRSMKPSLMIRHAPPPPFELAWAKIADGGLAVHEIPGDHMEIVRDPLASMTAETITDCLRG
ncbi:amino acid adenylation domain-containing protein [Phenylobacterium sp.]|uniref:amino acid adenylation domain-containing protein n=1 Tax=Phenylobacterium sp. TaxID=1871053 RepID=UPI002F42D68E